MNKFHVFTQAKRIQGEYGPVTKRKAVYINLDAVTSVFENHYGSIDETVIGLINGQSFVIEEPMNEVIKILERKEETECGNI